MICAETQVFAVAADAATDPMTGSDPPAMRPLTLRPTATIARFIIFMPLFLPCPFMECVRPTRQLTCGHFASSEAGDGASRGRASDQRRRQRKVPRGTCFNYDYPDRI